MSGLRDLVGGGAECSTGNSLSAFTKQLDQDRSLQQDRFQGLPSVAGPSGFGLRDAPVDEHIQRERDMAEEFFRQQGAGFDAPKGMDMNGSRFEMRELREHLEGMVPAGEDWAKDFMTDAGPQPREFDEFQKIYGQHEQAHGFQHQHMPEAWAQEFHAVGHEVSAAPAVHDADFEQAFQQARQEAQMSWEAEFAKHSNKEGSWAEEFTSNDAQAQSWIDEFAKQEGTSVDAANTQEALAQTAGMLLDSVQGSANPKFEKSQFLKFMQQLRDREVGIEGDKVVENVAPYGAAQDWAKEFNTSVDMKNWEEEFSATAGPSNAGPRNWANEFTRTDASKQDWSHEFQQQNPTPLVASDKWNEEFAHQQANQFGNKWTEEFEKSVGADFNAENVDEIFEDIYKSAWDYDGLADINTGRALGAKYSEYEFTPNNPYLEGRAVPAQGAYQNLTDAILALEATIQQDPTNAGAWHDLGIRQQENENDVAAIAALRQAVHNDPKHLDSWLALSVSYTNENAREDAYDALESWLYNNDKYTNITARQRSNGSRHDEVSGMYLAAVRQSTGELDADVQIGLGVLFNISDEYSKAVDCFHAALSTKPDDYLLWNKLGATLANSNQSDQAIEAYFRALEINPSYVRARYNLAISCIQMGSHKEAAEHLLGALSVQEANIESVMGDRKDMPDMGLHAVQSGTVWSTLKMVMDGHLRRHDLALACERRDLSAFKNDFDF